MDYTSLIMMAIVWGGLLFYFLTPIKRNPETVAHGKINFLDALKYSFVNVTFHKKAILALTLIVVTIFVTSWSQQQTELYNEMHGINSQTQPINYTLGIVMYSILIYLLHIIGKSLKFLAMIDKR
ncbi:hypothetical protein ACFSFW_11055 [Fredinandcohnia salidurans]|uniref:DUF4149 domain-containing protein n=1 Tax=Fredinandcohnia salidurans TaxID=2595041 RepID=A0ABW4MMG7_9BACI|nr:hypothetical protein [Fredinandcohnia onubensis]